MAKIKILLADNDKDFLETRCEFIGREGYSVIKASSPVEAMEILRNEIIDLAVIDIRLINDDDEKDISGFELAKEASHTIPVIFLTGYHSDAYMRQALAPQFDGNRIAFDFLAKEQGPVALISAIRRTLEISRQSEANSGSAHGFPVVKSRAKPAKLRDDHVERKLSSSAGFVRLDVPEQMLKDYELARLHARWIGWIRIGLVACGVIVFLYGMILVLTGERDEGSIGVVAGAIAAGVGGLITKVANDANRRWEQFHKELILFFKEATKKNKGGR